MKLVEGLRQNDLVNLIKPYFSVDIFEPKFGKNEEIVVVAFVADAKEPAEDLKSFIENESIMLDGDGEQSRDFSYVDDVCQANYLVGFYNDNLKGEIYNG